MNEYSPTMTSGLAEAKQGLVIALAERDALREDNKALLAALEAICLQYYGSGAPGGGLPLVNGVRACTTGLAEEIAKARAALKKAKGGA